VSAITVNYEQLSQAQELLARQAQHSDAVRRYIQTHCRLQQSDFGLLLQVLFPVNELVVYIADQGMERMGDLYMWSSRTMAATIDGYVESDRVAYERSSNLLKRLGEPTSPFADPRDSVQKLGGATGGASDSYGQDPSHWHPTIDVITGTINVGNTAGEFVADTVGSAASRVQNWNSRGGVTERTDPVSYLVTPQHNVSFIEDLRWSAGVLLGSIDWVAEQFLGVSVLEEYVFKPFGGDWEAMDRGSIAWSHCDKALTETASNFTGLPGQLDEWTGRASAEFLGAMTVLGGATMGVSYAFGYASDLLDKVRLVAKLACAAIGSILKKISHKLMRIAIESSVPIAGWIVAAAEIALAIDDVIKWVRRILTLITMILDAITEFIEAKEKIVEAFFAVEDLVSAGIRKAATA
jgi:hypothetical protein